MEILPSTLQYLQLTDDHPIKIFCKKHKISDYVIQEALMRLINECICSFLNEIVAKNISVSVEETIAEEMAKRAEEL